MLDLTHRSRSNCPSSLLFAGIRIKTARQMHWPQHMQNVTVSKQIFTKSKFNPCASIFCLTMWNNQGTSVQALQMEKMWRVKAAEGGEQIWSLVCFYPFSNFALMCDFYPEPQPTVLCRVVLNYTEEERVERKKCRRHTIHWNHNWRNSVNLPTSRLLCFPLQTFPVPSPPTMFFFPLLSSCWKNTEENCAFLTSLPQEIFERFLKIFHQPIDLVCWCSSNWIICVFMGLLWCLFT